MLLWQYTCLLVILWCVQVCAVTTNTCIIKKIHNNYVCQFNIDRDVSILPTNHLSEGLYNVISTIDFDVLQQWNCWYCLLPGDRLGRELQKHCKRYNTIHCHTKTAAQVIRSSLIPRRFSNGTGDEAEAPPSFPSLVVQKSMESLVSFLTWAWCNLKMAKICITNSCVSCIVLLTTLNTWCVR